MISLIALLAVLQAAPQQITLQPGTSAVAAVGVTNPGPERTLLFLAGLAFVLGLLFCAVADAQTEPEVIMASASATTPVEVSADQQWSVFALAAENIGYPTSSAAAAKGDPTGLIFSVVNNLTTLPIWVEFCQTDPTTGQCLLGFQSGSVYLQTMPAGQPYTFSVWIAEGYPHPILPAGETGVVVILVYDLEFNIYGMLSVPVESAP